jgi:hypothetical protein
VTPPVERAVEIALEFEASAAESHSRGALKALNPEMERLLRNLGGEDQLHVGRLKDFAARRCSAPRSTVHAQKAKSVTGFHMKPR